MPVKKEGNQMAVPTNSFMFASVVKPRLECVLPCLTQWVSDEYVPYVMVLIHSVLRLLLHPNVALMPKWSSVTSSGRVEVKIKKKLIFYFWRQNFWGAKVVIYDYLRTKGSFLKYLVRNKWCMSTISFFIILLCCALVTICRKCKRVRESSIHRYKSRKFARVWSHRL